MSITINNEFSEKQAPVSELDQLLKDMVPLIKHAIKQFPTYIPQYYEEMYNTCVVAILENYPTYDPEKGGLSFFCKHMEGAIYEFIAKEVHGFSGADIFKKYRALKRAEPFLDDLSLSEEDYSDLESATGLSKTSVDNVMAGSKLSKPLHFERDDDVYSRTGLPENDPFYSVSLSELEFVMHKALKTLTSSEKEFLYDMIGLYGRSALPDYKLCEKYSLTARGLHRHVRLIRRKMLGSRTLRTYLGKRNASGGEFLTAAV